MQHLKMDVANVMVSEALREAFVTILFQKTKSNKEGGSDFET